MGRMIFVIIMVMLCGATIAAATTPCNLGYTFLGFGDGGGSAFWENKVGGECVPGLILSRYDFARNTSRIILKWTQDCESQDPETGDSDKGNPKEGQPSLKQYNAKKKVILRRAHAVVPPSDAGQFFVRRLEDDGRPDTKTAFSNVRLVLKRDSGSCEFRRSRFEMDREQYLGDLQFIGSAYVNPRYQSWLLLTYHDSISPMCCTWYGRPLPDQHLSLFSLADCR